MQGSTLSGEHVERRLAAILVVDVADCHAATMRLYVVVGTILPQIGAV